MYVLLGVLYFLGIMACYFLSQYYNWEVKFNLGYNAPPIPIFAFFWIISLPIVFSMMSGEKIAELGRQHRKQKEEKIRVRVIEEKEAQILLEEAEKETEEYYQNLRKRA